MLKFAHGKITGYQEHCSKGRTASKKTLGAFDYEPRSDGHKYMYVAVRACTADVPNLNCDMLPHSELKDAYKTFIGSYVYLNHDNMDPEKARGAIIDAAYHDEDADDRWIEILEELDEERCPKLCSLIRSGEIDTVSMGCEVESTTCSICGNVAEFPYEYCEHIQQKGATFGGKMAYEICNGINFFECSWVYDPADPTATVQALQKEAGRKVASRKASEDIEFTFKQNGSELKYTPGTSDYFDTGFGNWLPGDPDEIEGYAGGEILANGKMVAEIYIDANSVDYLEGDEYEMRSEVERNLEWRAEDICAELDYLVNEEGKTLNDEVLKEACEDYSEVEIETTADWSTFTAKKDNDEYMDSFADAPRIPDEIHDIEDDLNCPLCGSDGFDGEYCDVCGYQEPPEGFGPIELETVEDYEKFDEEEREEDEKEAAHKKAHTDSWVSESGEWAAVDQGDCILLINEKTREKKQYPYEWGDYDSMVYTLEDIESEIGERMLCE